MVLVGLAMALQQRRDFGLGMISPRPGPAEAPGMTVPRLTWRLHRRSLVTWMVAFALLGLVVGNLATSVGDVLASNPSVAAVLASGATTTDQLAFGFVSTILQVVGIIAAVMGAQVMTRVHAEEVDYRVEPLLAGAVRRPAYLASNFVTAFLAEAVALLTAGTVLGAVAAHGSTITFTDVLAQAAATIPAVWVLTGVAVAVICARPAVRLAGWLVIVATFGITLLGPTFKFPHWALSISPMHHIPIVNTPDSSWTPLVVLALHAGLFVTIGLVGYRHRDII